MSIAELSRTPKPTAMLGVSVYFFHALSIFNISHVVD